MEHKKPKDYNLYFYHDDIFKDSDTIRVFIEKDYDIDVIFLLLCVIVELSVCMCCLFVCVLFLERHLRCLERIDFLNEIDGINR